MDPATPGPAPHRCHRRSRTPTRLDEPSGVTAVMAANGQMALGVIRALTERGFRVPDDVSVTGMDDISELGYFLPPLTTLRLDFASEGEDAFRRMLTRIDGVRRPPVQVRPAELVVRASTGPAR